jgi:hypothetical protein
MVFHTYSTCPIVSTRGSAVNEKQFSLKHMLMALGIFVALDWTSGALKTYFNYTTEIARIKGQTLIDEQNHALLLEILAQVKAQNEASR